MEEIEQAATKKITININCCQPQKLMIIEDEESECAYFLCI
ncbi:MAG: hypothetical protein KME32_14895 [Mojavia pulchra JT2-VF2]|uniref:Uncharacterized protein n=1 Tax=Mojavia pulchra JT2-VF2 TaxID=287848 RepID=A0A951Q0Y7_9NOST|nr:hypothetical protein [Mojavia pulchra JT2-VF2]